LCAMCSKGKAKTVVNAPTSNFLDANALNKLAQRQEIGPDDSLSMIGVKRQRELMEKELSQSPQDASCEDNSSESEESKHDPPHKRQKTTEAWSISTSAIQRTCVRSPLIVSCTDAEVI
jgi:hypothetical protein